MGSEQFSWDNSHQDISHNKSHPEQFKIFWWGITVRGVIVRSGNYPGENVQETCWGVTCPRKGVVQGRIVRGRRVSCLVTGFEWSSDLTILQPSWNIQYCQYTSTINDIFALYNVSICAHLKVIRKYWYSNKNCFF